MNLQESYPASSIKPYWQLFIDDQWLVVDMVIDSETPDGTRYITIAFRDSKNLPIKLRRTEMIPVPARPPDLPPAVEP